MREGRFTISLDFELRWGGIEKWDAKKYEKYFLETRRSIPLVLQLFEINNIRATWATVGFLFAKNKKQLIEYCPHFRPTYKNFDLNYYNYFNEVGIDEKSDRIHYGFELIQQILATKGQELGTHTFSHFYCQEEGQTVDQFKSDLLAAQKIAFDNFNVKLYSLVFPRNQYNANYLNVAQSCGIKVVRTNPDVWFWQKKLGRFNAFFRAIDTLFSISSTLTFKITEGEFQNIQQLSASRFFRPLIQKEKYIQKLKIKRIKSEMEYAAKNGYHYHLWWHPHNFGNDVEGNIAQLEIIIKHYQKLNRNYGFKSTSMYDSFDTKK